MNSNKSPLIQWLLEGDVSVQFQTHRDILGSQTSVIDELQKRIATQGWGKRFLEQRDDQTGLWGNGIYGPKWISTHYTLLELKNIGLHPTCQQYIESSDILLNKIWSDIGKTKKHSKEVYLDLCVSAMIISICCYAKTQSPKINEIIDYLLEKQFSDGGWNCNWGRDTKSSLHTTLSVLEAFRDYETSGYDYRLGDVKEAAPKAWEFILKKRLFRSVRTGEVIDTKMLMLSFPCRWKYDILRCMDYFASAQKSWDERIEEALQVILKKMKKNNHWPVQQKHTGKTHFDMEQTGGDSRWNTLRVLRILKAYKPELFDALTS